MMDQTESNDRETFPRTRAIMREVCENGLQHERKHPYHHHVSDYFSGTNVRRDAQRTTEMRTFHAAADATVNEIRLRRAEARLAKYS